MNRISPAKPRRWKKRLATPCSPARLIYGARWKRLCFAPPPKVRSKKSSGLSAKRSTKKRRRKNLRTNLVLRFADKPDRSEEHTSELQSPDHIVCRLLLEKKKIMTYKLNI